MQQHIVATWPASLSASTVVEPLYDAMCSVLCLPHVIVVHSWSQEFRSGLVIAAIIIGVLPPHHVPCSHGALPHHIQLCYV